MNKWLVFAMVGVMLAGCAESDPAAEGGDSLQADGPGSNDAPTALSTGFLRGVVFDAAIRPLENAEVTISQSGNEVAILTTDADGNWGVGDLEGGTYDIEVAKAGYVTNNVTGTVVAGEQTPDLIEIRLEVVIVDTSTILPIHMEGVMGCAHTGANWCAIVNIYSGANVVSDQSGAQFYDEIMAVGDLATTAITEIVWEAGNPLAEDLNLRMSAGNWEMWESFTVQEFYHSETGTSYIRHELGQEDLERNTVGVDFGLGIELFPAGGSGVPFGVTINQPFELFMHVFYGCEPIEGWSFVNGDVPECA